MAEKKRIMIVEDHPIFRLGLSELINQEDDLRVCCTAENIREAWNAFSEGEPDLIIADISLPDGDGIEWIKEITRHDRRIPVLMLSMHDELLYAERALHAGASGYIMKQEAMENVVSAIRQVLAGKTYLNERVKEHILSRISHRSRDNEKDPVERLTDRELEVFRLIGQGHRTREIADHLHLSVKTIGTYRDRIKEKLRLKHANELVRHAVHWVEKNPS
jgi:DNA-binding NarL/FixJ family response regulator